jgi:hypothetical protein
MFVLTALCSDPDCAEELTVEVDSLEELDERMCECDCTLVLLSVAELDLAAAA